MAILSRVSHDDDPPNPGSRRRRRSSFRRRRLIEASSTSRVNSAWPAVRLVSGKRWRRS
jgi:hypothetical protein